MTLNDLEGHLPVNGLSNAIRRTSVRHFAQFELTRQVARSSAIAEFLVYDPGSHSLRFIIGLLFRKIYDLSLICFLK